MGKAKSNRRIPQKKRGRRDEEGPRSGLGRDVAGVALLALALAIGLALATFSAVDGMLIARGMPPASNLVGLAGHHGAAALYRLLGFSALVIPIAVAVFAVRLLRGAGRRPTLLALAAYGALTISTSALGHLVFQRHHLASFPAGGIVGAALAQRAVALFSTVGGALVVGAAGLAALIVATGFEVQRFAGATLRVARVVAAFAVKRFARALDEHRRAVAELRAEEAEERAQREAEAIALAGAVVEAEGAAEQDEAFAAAAALAREQALRAPVFDEDPAWAQESSAAEAAACPRKEGPSAGAATDAPCEPPADLESLTPAAPERPQIVLSQAMQKEKKRKEKAVPSFAFTQAGAEFRLPSTELLDARESVQRDLDEGGLQKTAEVIVATLRQHGVDGAIRHIRPGPVVTLYEFIPVAGVKLAKIENLDKELTMALSATRIRIIAPIPGKGVVGIEVPNKDRATVYLREVLESEAFARAGGFLPLALGKNVEGVPYCVDLQRMPHLLIAGTTGAGKSVGLNTMILSLLFRQTPDQVRMIMVDPKMTELSMYEDIPHLLLPVVTDPQKASRALQWAVDEMERRTQILADTGSKDLKSYNSKVEKLRASGRTFEDEEKALPREVVVVDVGGSEAPQPAETTSASVPAPDGTAPIVTAPFEDPTEPPPADPIAASEEKKLPQKLPYVVVIIDELADLMMTAPREVEISLARLAQKARATGIHLMVATQRPSTDVVTGMIKNNFPARLTFRLASRHDSTTIINGPGAETLLGDGDMLVMTATAPVTRVQGAFVSEDELNRVVGFLKQQGKPVYDVSILKARDGAGAGARDADEDDPVYDEAVSLVSRMEEVSVSKLQREMRLGYNKAAKIIERMEREGIVGPPNGVKPRQVLIRPAGEASAVPNV